MVNFSKLMFWSIMYFYINLLLIPLFMLIQVSFWIDCFQVHSLLKDLVHKAMSETLVCSWQYLFYVPIVYLYAVFGVHKATVKLWYVPSSTYLVFLLYFIAAVFVFDKFSYFVVNDVCYKCSSDKVQFLISFTKTTIAALSQ